MNRWRYRREGACLKPLVTGGRVDPLKVTTITLTLRHKAPGRAIWHMTPLLASTAKPALLDQPILPQGQLLDSLGQFALKDWSGKTSGENELVTRLREQLAISSTNTSFVNYSKWGGWRDHRVTASGFFRLHHDKRRWWLVDPEGCLFWSTGPDCVRPVIESNIKQLHHALAWLPAKDGEFTACYLGAKEVPNDEIEAFDYLKANFTRAFGAKDWHTQWQRIIYPLLRDIGFNTAGNWSDCECAAANGMPYVLPMKQLAPRQHCVARIFRDFPDVFDPAYEEEATLFASSLAATADDPAMIGYFLMNEPEWCFTPLTPAEGMLRNTANCATRRALANELRQHYANDEAAMTAAWQMPVTFAQLESGWWTAPLTASALRDLERFSTLMVKKLYRTLSAACRKVDCNHLNLGTRFAWVPDNWILDAMSGCFDVFSINCYRTEADDRLGPVCERLNIPTLIGEWHFGALDAGLPAPGLGHNPNQAERAKAYRYYLEQSAAKPWCVGAHWFTLYDQSAIGRGDGENYNIGFLDVCHHPYEALTAAARETHARLYQVANGELAPCNTMPEYAERLNM